MPTHEFIWLWTRRGIPDAPCGTRYELEAPV